MKFTLIMTICSQIYGTCLPPFEQDYLYDSHFDCATIGYLRSFDVLNKLGAEDIPRISPFLQQESHLKTLREIKKGEELTLKYTMYNPEL